MYDQYIIYISLVPRPIVGREKWPGMDCWCMHKISNDSWDIGSSCVLPGFSPLHFMCTLVYCNESSISAVWQACVPDFQGRACTPEGSQCLLKERLSAVHYTYDHQGRFSDGAYGFWQIDIVCSVCYVSMPHFIF